MRFSPLVIIILTLSLPRSPIFAADAPPPTLLLVRGGKVVASKSPATIANKAAALLESASVGLIASNHWEQITASPSFLQVTFPKPRTLKVMTHIGLGPRQCQDQFVTAILIPLPENDWPKHALARAGTNIFCVAKYSPIALKHLALEPDLALKKIKPYSDLLNLPE